MFKQHDFKQTGFVSVSTFKDVLKANRVNLNDEDLFSLMRRLDKDVTGLINYNRFLNDIIKP
jgi:Ca2+-binding EF-hand superfamily protein